jgi:uncharacterized protein
LKFRLEDIPPEGKEETFFQDERWLDERLAGEENRNFQFGGPITVRFHLSRSGALMLVRSRIEVPMEWTCARCGERYALVLASEVAANFKPRPNTPWPEEVELSRVETETDYFDGDEVDLTGLVQDQVFLAFPAKPLCRKDCRGLCPHCGKNLNREACDCQGKGIDPRFAVLRDYRLH